MTFFRKHVLMTTSWSSHRVKLDTKSQCKYVSGIVLDLDWLLNYIYSLYHLLH